MFFLKNSNLNFYYTCFYYSPLFKFKNSVFVTKLVEKIKNCEKKDVFKMEILFKRIRFFNSEPNRDQFKIWYALK